ncbi:unnamed protein product [Ceutorhynchus assimilis]|uniref:PPM-type phosphatase domain-containing protein n=1 Tax=Ceutorhynchus assimilis TaxID=467358 RepID=A0A9N9MTM0_9CUCU|nr:unnamed protein product [Ceutorhynchus assimilis]
MPSLRKRVSTYLRQLSFHNEPRDKKNNVNENAFVTKYLQGSIALTEGPPIIYGKNPTDLPNYELGKYDSGPNTIIGCYSGPNGGLTTVKRTEKHLSVPDDDIDFIDNPEDDDPVPQPIPKKSPKRVSGQPIDNTTMMIKVAGHEYCVTNKPKRHSKSYSLGSISDFNIEVEKTKIDKEFYNCDENSNSKITRCKENQRKCDNTCAFQGTTPKENVSTNVNTNNVRKEEHNLKIKQKSVTNINPNIPKTMDSSRKTVEAKKGQNYSLSKSRSDGNPFHNKKKGKIIQVQRQQSHRGDESISVPLPDDTILPSEWNKKSEFYYGVSDSLYDQNQVTHHKNGDPIADCFGVIARGDSAILAVADGVNWGEKASIAAKSAVHASLHYLNKTIFNDTKPFEKLTTKTDDAASGNDPLNPNETTNLIANTREVFVCLLRAFNCAHDLILENKGMLTTLTVAIILPLKQKLPQRNETSVRSNEPHYVCCVCNVGDTLAYVYSQRHGIRELTKGSHDVNSNRDMRDALGALGPVDGINPELSNLTLSITTLNKGDIVMVASDGLTDNFDPNVCKFTVNSSVDAAKSKIKKTSTGVLASQQKIQEPEHKVQTVSDIRKPETEPLAQKPPVKPPRRTKNRSSISSTSQSERSSSSVEKDVKNNSNEPKSSELNDPLKAHFLRENSLEEPKPVKKIPPVIENKASSLRKQASTQLRQETTRKITPPSKSIPKTLDSNRSMGGYKFLKSKTSLDLRSTHNQVQILRNDDGIPYVTPIQRYELQLLLMEDILRNGISGRDLPITTAKKLCESLVSFTLSITSAKRRTLEDQDMYFDHRNGVLVEVTNQEKKMRRKKGLERVQTLPGKLDHVTVVAYNVGNVA